MKDIILKILAYLEETKTRATSETSDYFKPLQKMGFYVFLIGILLAALFHFFPNIKVEEIAKYIPDMIKQGLTVFIGASLTQKK